MERFSLRVFGVGMKDGTNDENHTRLSPQNAGVLVTKSFVSTTCSKRSCFGGVSALREHFESGRFHLKKR